MLPLLATQKIQTMFAGLKPSTAPSGATTGERPDPTEAAASLRLTTASFGYRAEARRHAHRPLCFTRDPKDALITSLPKLSSPIAATQVRASRAVSKTVRGGAPPAVPVSSPGLLRDRLLAGEQLRAVHGLVGGRRLDVYRSAEIVVLGDHPRPHRGVLPGGAR